MVGLNWKETSSFVSWTANFQFNFYGWKAWSLFSYMVLMKRQIIGPFGHIENLFPKPCPLETNDYRSKKGSDQACSVLTELCLCVCVCRPFSWEGWKLIVSKSAQTVQEGKLVPCFHEHTLHYSSMEFLFLFRYNPSQAQISKNPEKMTSIVSISIEASYNNEEVQAYSFSHWCQNMHHY